VEVSKSDLQSSIWILILNIVVAVPGYLLFYYGIVAFDYSTNVWSVFVDFLLLLVVVDFLVFIFHLLAHRLSFFKNFHLVHHSHVEFNELSLYVMHPVEAIGLGIIFTLLFIFMSFNIYAVIIFLIFNWYWGVVAHFTPTDNQKSTLLTNNLFHATHHKEANYNYGFYTTIWDRIFKSYY
jgi:sterol desaturase/sphingolipid hydroxylase (fatty acid hydroxylase superfamily)